MKAELWVSLLVGTIIVFLFFPLRFNGGIYADLKEKKFGVKLYFFNILRLFRIDGVVDGLNLKTTGSVNKDVDLLSMKMSAPKGLYLLKAVKINKLNIDFWHDIVYYFSNSALLKSFIYVLGTSLSQFTSQKYNAVLNSHFIIGKEGFTAEGVFTLIPIRLIITIIKKAVKKYGTKTKSNTRNHRSGNF